MIVKDVTFGKDNAVRIELTREDGSPYAVITTSVPHLAKKEVREDYEKRHGVDVWAAVTAAMPRYDDAR